MTPFEIYTFIICLIVYVLLAGLGVFVVITVYNLTKKLIKSGANDEELIDEYKKQQEKKKKCMFDCILSILLCLVLIVVFAFSTYVGCTKDKYYDDTPTFKIVNSSSMSKKNEKNKYLFENNLDNQFQTFDLILLYNIPKEEDLKLYDIVVYEIDDILIVHRIVGIEEPNKYHPEERWFLLQGDAISQTDKFPVRYSQMRGIYRNERVPFVGSFVAFMQSPAGYMCIILVAIAIIFTPIIEKKLNKEKAERLALLGYAPIGADGGNDTDNDVDNVSNTSNTEDKSALFAKLKENKTSPSLEQKLESVPVAKERLQSVKEFMDSYSGLRVIDSKKQITYKKGNTPIVRFAVKGKTLNAFIALDPKQYEGTKYRFKDVSASKKNKNYPMRIKITSDRQLRWVKELISQAIDKGGKA